VHTPPTLSPPLIPIERYSTDDLPPDERYQAWLDRGWFRVAPIFRTVPAEPFNTTIESAAAGRLLVMYTEITAMSWERRVDDIRDSDFQPFSVNMMVQGTAQGDMDGRPFFEPAGTYHFHDMARPSLHGSTASLTYSLIIPRDVAKTWFGPIEALHGLVVTGELAKALMELVQSFWRLLPGLTPEGAARFERAFLEMLALGVEVTVPTAPVRVEAGVALRAAAIEAIDHRTGLERASAAELCRVLNVPVDQLSTAFRQDGGVAAYLLTRRLDEARAALTGLQRVEPIGNIAHRLGFSDAAHLSRTFRQRFGLSPRAYRKMDGKDEHES